MNLVKRFWRKHPYWSGAIIVVVGGISGGILVAYCLMQFSVGGYFWPVVKTQWGTVIELGQCTRSGKSSSRCAIAARADDGRVFHGTRTRPAIIGQRVPIAEYQRRGEAPVYFQFSVPPSERK